MLTLKPSDFRPAHQKPSQFRPPTLKSSQFQPPTQQPNQFHPYTDIKLSSIPPAEIKSISPSFTKTKSISMLTRKPSDFRPALKNMSISTAVKALVRWATGKRLTNRQPKLSLITLSPPLNSGILGLRMGLYVPTPKFFYNLWGPRKSDSSDS